MSEMNHERFEDLKEAYVLQALPEEEHREMEGYLALHPELKPELEELGSLASILALSPAEHNPSPRLRKRLMRTVESEAANEPSERGSVLQRLREFLSVQRLALGAAAVALVALFGWNVLLQSEVQDLQGRLEDRQTFAMQGSGTASSTQARVVELDRRQAIVLADDMPSIPEGETFQIWVIEDGTPKPAGTFEPGDTVAAPITDSLRGAQTVAITVEPDGGSQQPTSDPVLQTNLKT